MTTLLRSSLFVLSLVLFVASAASAKMQSTPWARWQDSATKTWRVTELDTGRFENDGPRGGELCPIVVSDGVLFRFAGNEARRVAVVGDFNDWDERAHPLKRRAGGLWRATVDLDSGDHVYGYVVDGEWLRDPENPVIFVDDEVGEMSLVRLRGDEVVLPRPPGFREGSIGLTAGYDRVNQVTLTTTLSYDNRVQRHPVLSIGAGYSFGQEAWLYDVGLTQPLLGPFLEVGARAYRRTATNDRDRIGDTENTLATFFFREDWRDYHQAEGVEASVALHLGRAIEVTATWKGEDHLSLSKTTDWGLFGGDKRMRANPAATEGELRSVVFEYAVDTRNDHEHPTRGFLARGSFEISGDELGGDFDFRRAAAELRRYMKLSRGHFFDFRILGGQIDEASAADLTGFEAVPVQERFYLGGTGTMRATQFKSLVGDHVLLANVEMRVEVFHDFQIAVFADIGDAWIDAERDFDVKTDAGLGFQDDDASFRINLAKKIDREGEDELFVSARIQRMF